MDSGLPEAADLILQLAAVGIDMTAVGRTLEENGIAAFEKAYRDVLADLTAAAGTSGIARAKGSKDASRRPNSARRR